MISCRCPRRREIRFKIDENLHEEVAAIFRSHNHDAMTVYEQQVQGVADPALGEVCRAENRGLITLDLDFSNILNYPPADYKGIIVLRLADQSRPSVRIVMRRVIALLESRSPAGQLWIVDESSVRVRTA